MAARITDEARWRGGDAVQWREEAAVIDIDVEKRDLQQCADAVMRLRAEWLWSIGTKDRIAFNYTGGGRWQPMV